MSATDPGRARDGLLAGELLGWILSTGKRGEGELRSERNEQRERERVEERQCGHVTVVDLGNGEHGWLELHGQRRRQRRFRPPGGAERCVE